MKKSIEKKSFKQNHERIFGLDVIRAIAILLVVFSHLYYLIDSDNAILIAFSGLFGYFGVELFFVLSGFLIGTILLKHFLSKEFNFKVVMHFLRRRWMRTLPNYYLVLLLNIAVAFLLSFPMKHVVHYFFFLQNFEDYHIDFFGESWSLTVEEWAYISIPLFLLLVGIIIVKNKKRGFLLSTIFLIIVFHLVRYSYQLKHVIPSMEVWNNSIKAIAIYRIDSILFGFLIAWFFHFYTQKLKQYRVYLFILSVHVFIFQFLILNYIGVNIVSSQLYFTVFYFTLTSACIALALPLFIFWKHPLKIIGKPIEIISKISYSVYLLHYGIVMVLLKYSVTYFNFFIPNYWLILIYLFLTISASYLLYRYFEKPIMDKR